MTILISFMIVVVIWLPFPMLYAWALQTIWLWYAVPIFGLPALSFSAAFGVGLIAQFVTRNVPQVNSGRPAKDKAWDLFAVSVRPLAVVFAGWVYLQIWPLP